MGLLSIFQRQGSAANAPQRAASSAVDAAEAVRSARTRARRRLMGATVLLLVGVIGFPFLFETQPRPIPVDLPIEIPARNTVPPLEATAPRGNRLAAAGAAVSGTVLPAEPASAPTVAANPAPTLRSVAPLPAATSAATTSAAMATASMPAAPARAVASVPVAAKPAATPSAATPVPVPAATKPASAPGPATPPLARAAEAKPVDAGASDPAAAGMRYVVQVGAFAEQPKAHEARMKVEKLGLKTFIQVVDTGAGKRIRVRVGPYPSKAEAEKAAAKIKGGGLPAAVLYL